MCWISKPLGNALFNGASAASWYHLYKDGYQLWQLQAQMDR